jgi:hypothetical protein
MGIHLRLECQEKQYNCLHVSSDLVLENCDVFFSVHCPLNLTNVVLEANSAATELKTWLVLFDFGQKGRQRAPGLDGDPMKCHSQSWIVYVDISYPDESRLEAFKRGDKAVILCCRAMSTLQRLYDGPDQVDTRDKVSNRDAKREGHRDAAKCDGDEGEGEGT